MKLFGDDEDDDDANDNICIYNYVYVWNDRKYIFFETMLKGILHVCV